MRVVLAAVVGVGGCSFPGTSQPIDDASPVADATPPERQDAPPGSPDAPPPPPMIDAPDDSFLCPANGYVLRAPGSCHRNGTMAKTWAAAEADCEDDASGTGAHLVVISDSTENGFIPAGVWIGFTENIVPGDFRWVTGAAVTFTGWASGEPVSGGSTCTEARSDGWHDDGCTETKLFVCEYDGIAADPNEF